MYYLALYTTQQTNGRGPLATLINWNIHFDVSSVDNFAYYEGKTSKNTFPSEHILRDSHLWNVWCLYNKDKNYVMIVSYQVYYYLCFIFQTPSFSCHNCKIIICLWQAISLHMADLACRCHASLYSRHTQGNGCRRTSRDEITNWISWIGNYLYIVVYVMYVLRAILPYTPQLWLELLYS